MEKVRGTGKGKVITPRVITVCFNQSLKDELKRVLDEHKKYMGCFTEEFFKVEGSQYPICSLKCGLKNCHFEVKVTVLGKLEEACDFGIYYLVLVTTNRAHHFNDEGKSKVSDGIELLQLHSLRLFSCAFATSEKSCYKIRGVFMEDEIEFKKN